jgi:hypothetical protein
MTTATSPRRGRPTTHADPTRQAWSLSFRAYLEREGISQKQAAEDLKVHPSLVHYWCRGTLPKDGRRARIETWSHGAVRA